MTAFLRIGHRGASGYEPENTLRSIRRALEMGANGIEIDIRLSRDGEPMVFHDASLLRRTGVRGRVSDWTREELRRLDAGCGEQIPTLSEVLALVAGRAWLNIELKATGSGTVALETLRREVRDEAWMESGGVVISSFLRRELAVIRRRVVSERLPVRIGLLTSRPLLSIRRMTTRYGAASLHLPRHLASEKTIRKAKAAGVKVLVFTVNNDVEIARLRQWGADGVFTDFPDRAGEEGALESACGTKSAIYR